MGYNQVELLQRDCARLQTELVTTQLEIKELREALKHWADSSLEEPSLSLCIRHTEQVLSTPTNDQALRDYVADEMVNAANELYVYSAKDELVDYTERYRKGEVK